MKFCPSCGQGNEDDATFCQGCGAWLDSHVAPGEYEYRAPPGPPTGPAPGYPYARREMENNAIAALIMGIAGFLVCPLVLGILAVIFGNIALKNIRASRGMLDGEGYAKAGLILGWVNIGLSILVGIIIAIAMAVGISEAATALITLALLA